MKSIELPPVEVLREHFTYNPESGEIRWRKPLANCVKEGDIAGGVNNEGYINIKLHCVSYKAHRIAWALHYGEEPNLYIDHKNGDRSDNRIANLRLVTKGENNYNSKLHKHNVAGHRGVNYHKGNKKWRARIKLNGKDFTIGYFDCKEDAIAARLKVEADNNIFVFDR